MEFKDLERKFQISLFKMGEKARLRLWRKLAIQLGDGISIVLCVQTLRDMAAKGSSMYFALDEWWKVLSNGKPFFVAAQDWVTPQESMLLRAGEEAGDIPEALRSILKIREATKRVKMAVRAGLVKPVMLIVAAFGMLYGLSFQVIPSFQKAMRGEWRGTAAQMVELAHFSQQWLLWIVLFVIIAIIAIFVSMPIWSGSSRTYVDRYAPYSLYRVIQGSSWLIGLAALVQAGVRVEDALVKLSSQGSPWIRVRIDAALKGMRAGRDLGNALARSGYEFPDREIINDIRVYASQSDVDKSLRLVSNNWIEESVEKVNDMMGVVFVVLLLVAGVFIGYQVLGILDMTTQIASQATVRR